MKSFIDNVLFVEVIQVKIIVQENSLKWMENENFLLCE